MMISNLRKLEGQMVDSTGTKRDLVSYVVETHEHSLQHAYANRYVINLSSVTITKQILT